MRWTDWLIPGLLAFTIAQKDTTLLRIDMQARPLHSSKTAQCTRDTRDPKEGSHPPRGSPAIVSGTPLDAQPATTAYRQKDESQ